MSITSNQTALKEKFKTATKIFRTFSAIQYARNEPVNQQGG